MLTLGYWRLKASAQKVMRSSRVSDPTLARFPDTPATGAYSGVLGSTPARAPPTGSDAISAAVKIVFRILALRVVVSAHRRVPGSSECEDRANLSTRRNSLRTRRLRRWRPRLGPRVGEDPPILRSPPRRRNEAGPPDRRARESPRTGRDVHLFLTMGWIPATFAAMS